jgi:protoporphyrinogen oxidase
MSAIILGGGIAGLATAHRLAERGEEVTVVEAAERLGGLGGTFEHAGRLHEKFYHTVTSTDTALLELLDAAGMPDQCEWRKTTMGMVVGGEHFAFNTPQDLLRFTALSLPQRVRLGGIGKSLRALGRGKDLDNITAEAWLRPLFGDAVWDKVIRPMFTMKFGGAEVPALYLYERLARESNVAMRAYPKAGYQGLADGIAASIERMGGTVLTGTPVESLEVHDGKVVVKTRAGEIDATWAVSTLALPLLSRIAGPRLQAELQLPDLDYMGVVNALYLTTRPLDGHYWSAVIDSGTEFDGQIEISALTGIEHFGGLHATYVMRYTSRHSELFAETDETVLARWTPQFMRLNDLGSHELAESFVFRTPFVEPVWPLGYTDFKPTPRVGDTPLFLATTAQAYPRVTSWNAAVQTAGDTVAAMEAVV